MLTIKYKKPTDNAGWTIFVFGVLAVLLGLIGLIKPEITLSLLGFEIVERTARSTGDYTLVLIFLVFTSVVFWAGTYSLHPCWYVGIARGSFNQYRSQRR